MITLKLGELQNMLSFSIHSIVNFDFDFDLIIFNKFAVGFFKSSQFLIIVSFMASKTLLMKTS